MCGWAKFITQVWLLDQFGVLHDGKVAYPEAIETCKRLAEAGRRLVVISNSSRREPTALPPPSCGAVYPRMASAHPC